MQPTAILLLALENPVGGPMDGGIPAQTQADEQAADAGVVVIGEWEPTVLVLETQQGAQTPAHAGPAATPTQVHQGMKVLQQPEQQQLLHRPLRLARGLHRPGTVPALTLENPGCLRGVRSRPAQLSYDGLRLAIAAGCQQIQQAQLNPDRGPVKDNGNRINWQHPDPRGLHLQPFQKPD
ncbi:hypothetical protein ES703_55150 [subsurface metagenome]